MTAFPCIVRKTVRVRKTSPVLMPLSYFQPIKLRLWIIQVTFVNRYITYCKSNLLLFLHLSDSYDSLQLLPDDQISHCHAESLSGRNRFSHRSFLFLIYGAIHFESSSKMVRDIQKYLKKKSSSYSCKSFTSMLKSPFCFLSE